MTPAQKRARLMIEGGAVQVMPRRLPGVRRRWAGTLWTAAWGTAAMVLLVAGMWGAFVLPAVVAP